MSQHTSFRTAVVAMITLSITFPAFVAGKGKGGGGSTPNVSYTTSIANEPELAIVSHDGLGTFDSIRTQMYMYTYTNARELAFDFSVPFDMTGVAPTTSDIADVRIAHWHHPDADIDIYTWVQFVFDADGSHWKIDFWSDQESPARLSQYDLDDDGQTDFMEVEIYPTTIGTLYKRSLKGNSSWEYAGTFSMPFKLSTVVTRQ